MRSAPLNYLATLAVAGLIWAATGVGLGTYLANAASLQALTTDDFRTDISIAFALVAAIAVLGCWYWYYYGSRPATLANMTGARRVWVSSFVVQVILMALALVVLVVLFRTEGLTAGNYLLVLLAAAVQAPAFFWAATAVMSPRGVKYIPWGVR